MVRTLIYFTFYRKGDNRIWQGDPSVVLDTKTESLIDNIPSGDGNTVFSLDGCRQLHLGRQDLWDILWTLEWVNCEECDLLHFLQERG